MRRIIAGLAYITLWAIAAGIICGLVALARENAIDGAMGFAVYFIAAHWLLKRLGHERGVFTAEPPVR
jgi:hypothetical protein